MLPELVESTSGLIVGTTTATRPRRRRASGTSVALLAPDRDKKRNPALERSAFLSRPRYRIGTVFRQLTERYSLKRVWGKDLWHLVSRLVREVLSHTIAFLLNHQGE